MVCRVAVERLSHMRLEVFCGDWIPIFCGSLKPSDREKSLEEQSLSRKLLNSPPLLAYHSGKGISKT